MMARYQIMYWKNIPAQVKATDDAGGRAKAMLPERFSMAIDAAAMAAGETEADSYLDGWAWSPVEDREGTAAEVVEALVAEIDQAYSARRLKELVQARPQVPGDF